MNGPECVWFHDQPVPADGVVPVRGLEDQPTCHACARMLDRELLAFPSLPDFTRSEAMLFADWLDANQETLDGATRDEINAAIRDFRSEMDERGISIGGTGR